MHRVLLIDMSVSEEVLNSKDSNMQSIRALNPEEYEQTGSCLEEAAEFFLGEKKA